MHGFSPSMILPIITRSPIVNAGIGLYVRYVTVNVLAVESKPDTTTFSKSSRGSGIISISQWRSLVGSFMFTFGFHGMMSLLSSFGSSVSSSSSMSAGITGPPPIIQGSGWITAQP